MYCLCLMFALFSVMFDDIRASSANTLDCNYMSNQKNFLPRRTDLSCSHWIESSLHIIHWMGSQARCSWWLGWRDKKGISIIIQHVLVQKVFWVFIHIDEIALHISSLKATRLSQPCTWEQLNFSVTGVDTWQFSIRFALCICSFTATILKKHLQISPSKSNIFKLTIVSLISEHLEMHLRLSDCKRYLSLHPILLHINLRLCGLSKLHSTLFPIHPKSQYIYYI